MRKSVAVEPEENVGIAAVMVGQYYVECPHNSFRTERIAVDMNVFINCFDNENPEDYIVRCRTIGCRKLNAAY